MTLRFTCHSHTKTYINVAENEIQLTDDLRRIAAWCCSNSLLANPEKTKLLLFGTTHMLNHVQDFRVTFLERNYDRYFQPEI
jgi:hypothetical protein